MGLNLWAFWMILNLSELVVSKVPNLWGPVLEMFVAVETLLELGALLVFQLHVPVTLESAQVEAENKLGIRAGSPALDQG